MQLDLGAAFSLDRDNRWMFVYTAGYVGNTETRISKSMNRILAREYYIRAQIFDPFWLYVGKVDKVFGIRNIDHKAFNREPLGLTQYAQSMSVVAHYVQENYEVTGQGFAGDPAALLPLREQKGAAGMIEFDPLENGRIGLSGLTSKSEAGESVGLLGVHWRQGLAKGNAVEFEIGTINKKDTVLNTRSSGSYSLAQTMIKLSRGFHLLTNIERYNADVAANTPETWKVGFGTLWFPINRVEIRLNFGQLRTFSSTTANEDIWMAQGQLHVSL